MSDELRRQLQELETDLIVAIDGLHMLRRRLNLVLRGEPPNTPVEPLRRSPG